MGLGHVTSRCKTIACFDTTVPGSKSPEQGSFQTDTVEPDNPAKRSGAVEIQNCNSLGWMCLEARGHKDTRQKQFQLLWALALSVRG